MKRFFDTELENLRSDLFRMGEKVIANLRSALKAYAESDADLARIVIGADDEIDELEVRIDEEAIRYLNLRTPVATELRVILTGMKASHELERAADEVTKIARRIRDLSSVPPLKVSVDLIRMGEIAAEMLRDALDCFVHGTEERALAVCHRDVEVDALNRQLCDELTEIMSTRPNDVARALDLVFVSKAIERIADHATNVAEETIYLINAKDVRHTAEVKKTAPIPPA
jgi:phosphate transport system protein